MTLQTKRQQIHNRARELATLYYNSRGYVPLQLKQIIEETSYGKASYKFNPNHDPSNGQFTSGSSTGVIDDPPIQPVYPIETIFAGLAAGRVFSIIRAMGGVDEEALAASGSTYNSVAKSIEDYLGGIPDRVFPNEAGDTIMMKDNKKIRFDINNPGNDDPHFHIQEQNESGNWVDAGDQHRYYFRDQE